MLMGVQHRCSRCYVNPLPAIDAGSDQFICYGDSITLSSTDVVSGHGIELDGINDYVLTGFDCDVEVPATTWEAWIYPTLQIQIGNK